MALYYIPTGRDSKTPFIGQIIDYSYHLEVDNNTSFAFDVLL